MCLFFPDASIVTVDEDVNARHARQLPGLMMRKEQIRQAYFMRGLTRGLVISH